MLPFTNGVINMRNGDVLEHSANHRITYTLPYAYDAGADTADIEAFVHNLFEDAPAERAFQTMVGYCLTGETDQKCWWQWFSDSGGGKTSAINILCGAMGKFASRGSVPSDELREGHKFQDIWSDELSSLPRKRLITIEELPPDFSLTALMNQATDGTGDQLLQLGRKGLKHASALKNSAKYWVSSNHVVKVPSSATGMVRRNRGVGLRFRFVEGYDAATAPEKDRPRDEELRTRLLLPAAWPGIAKWMLQGAAAYFAGAPLTCPLFDENTFSLQVRGDPYLEWLSETYTPTVPGEETRLSYNDVVSAYRSAGRGGGGGGGGTVWSSITSLLNTLTDVVRPATWTEHGMVVQGVEGLRARRALDDTWSAEWLEAKRRVQRERAIDHRYRI